MTKREILDQVGPRGCADLYHFYNKPLWLILDGYVTIDGDDAYRILPTDFVYKNKTVPGQYIEIPPGGPGRRQIDGWTYFKPIP